MSDHFEPYEEPLPPPQKWYTGPTDTQPFALAKLIKSNEGQAPPIYTSATFPWSTRSLQTLWGGSLYDQPDKVEQWNATVQKWTGAIAAGSVGRLFLFPKLATKTPTVFLVKLRDKKEKETDPDRKVTCCAWALSKDMVPLIILTTSSVIHVVDPGHRKDVGQLRGHGGDITSIAVDPFHPYLFCTTSRDQTTRVYDLTLRARDRPKNVHWPPDKRPSLAGPAFGLQCSEAEGMGMGRCVAVLVGGRSGGHEAGVLGAAFHPLYNILATCGVDRAVKIWRIPPLTPEGFAREDKPIFSSDMLHKARVLSVTWLSQDTLLTHSAPAWMRKPATNEQDEHDYYQENGTVVIWRWLGFDRFFPPGRPEQEIKRGVASDYRNSDSFKIISCYSLPMHTPNIYVYRTLMHDPIVVVPLGHTARIFNVTHFKAREPPAFPVAEEPEMVDLTERMRLSYGGDDEIEDEEARQRRMRRHKLPQPKAKPPRSLLENVAGWELPFPQTDAPAEMEIQSCEVACDGRVIVGVGIKGTMVIWKLRQDG
ncbi:hypothetical protein QCA50_001930 [Cerrena zonata]|uniref:WD40 repeat-like protein n=1 Tax=Cerrena zonata TaxID=2478898 RepID=A0AAW0GS45_9APHY